MNYKRRIKTVVEIGFSGKRLYDSEGKFKKSKLRITVNYAYETIMVCKSPLDKIFKCPYLLLMKEFKFWSLFTMI